MISDGIENCLQYCSNFNPEKSNNPFAYFTQIIYYAFIRRIQKEKKQQHVKHKIIENMNVDMLMDGDDDQSAYVDYLQKNFLPAEAVYKPKKKKKSELKSKGAKVIVNKILDIDDPFDVSESIMNELDERVFKKVEPHFDKTTNQMNTDIFDHK